MKMIIMIIILYFQNKYLQYLTVEVQTNNAYQILEYTVFKF